MNLLSIKYFSPLSTGNAIIQTLFKYFQIIFQLQKRLLLQVIFTKNKSEIFFSRYKNSSLGLREGQEA